MSYIRDLSALSLVGMEAYAPGETLQISANILCCWDLMSAYARISVDKGNCNAPICAQTISVKAPINCGVALTPSLSVSSSTILPIENQRADLRRCKQTLVSRKKNKSGRHVLVPTPPSRCQPYVGFLVLNRSVEGDAGVSSILKISERLAKPFADQARKHEQEQKGRNVLHRTSDFERIPKVYLHHSIYYNYKTIELQAAQSTSSIKSLRCLHVCVQTSGASLPYADDVGCLQ